MSDPSAILGANLLVWYKKGTGIYDAISGGSLVSADGTEVGRWEDSSGNGYHATRANGNIASGFMQWSSSTTDRGSGTLHFNADAVTDLALPNAVGTALSAAGQGQIWIRLVKPATSKNDTSGLFGNFGTDGAGNHYFWSDGNWYDGFGSNARKNCGAPSFDTTSAFHVASIWSATNDYKAMINNGADFSFTTASNTVAFRTSGVAIGSTNNTFGSRAFVSEIVIAKIKGSSTQNTDMQTYLSASPGGGARVWSSVII